MKKLFLAICFTMCLVAGQTLAEVSTIDEAEIASKEPKPIEPIKLEGLPNPENLKEVRSFFKKRFQTAITSDSADLGDLNKANSMDIQHSSEYIATMQEKKKSAFQRIYEHAMGRIDKPQAEFSPDTVFYEQVKKQNLSGNRQIEDIATVKVTLPNGEKVVAVAKEHIPYLLVSYDILPMGAVNVDEEVVVIANGEKLKNGLVKLMPKYTTSRSKVKKKLDITLLSVTVNGEEVPYRLTEIGNNILFEPKRVQTLETGVYTYRFKYLLNRKLWYYDEFTEFYADITGSYPNLVVASANAIVSVPDGKNFISQLSMTGYPKYLSTNRAVIAHLSSNALGFASLTPINAGEGMHILTSLDRNVFIKPSLGQRFVWFITDYGNTFFALLGFLAIFLSYFFSWKLIKENKSRLSIRFKQTAPMSRYILNGVYDKRSFVSGLLDLLRYKIIDIIKENDTILLIKKTDQTQNLPIGLKKLAEMLFSKHDSSLEVKTKNNLKFDRAFAAHEKYIKRYFKFLAWRLNAFYLAFSLSMLALTVMAISYIAINPLETFLIVSVGILTIMFYMWILHYPFASKITKYIVRPLAGFFVLFTVLLLGVYIHFLCALLIAITVGVIMEYSSRFSAKNGLIKSKTLELDKLKKYLKINAQIVSKGMEFELQQSNIFAFELEDLYEPDPKNEKIYRLDLAKAMLKLI